MQYPVEWFSAWFDSPYYHILYQNRDNTEAHQFIDTLITYLHPKPEDHILDLACGKGRHAVYLNQKGYRVTGLDLSAQNIAYARQFENERLQFFEHDMRNVFQTGNFNFILNLFTSFGYFDNETENAVALNAAATALKHGGKLVIDFMNTDLAIKNLVTAETKVMSGITFTISRKVEKGFILKNITFADKGQTFTFQERVRALMQTDFLEYFRIANLRLVATFGDYNLGPFIESESERMVFVLKK